MHAIHDDIIHPPPPPPPPHSQNEETKKPSTYIQNSHSMMQMTYNCAFLVARKPYEDGQQTNDTTHRDSEQHLQTNESVPNIYHVESSVDRK